jgi:hypothetical protein
VNGPLGFPIAAQGHIPGGEFMGIKFPETLHATFEKGAIVWHASGPNAGPNVVEGLDHFIQNFTARGNHPVWEDVGFSGDWLYVNMNLTDLTTRKVILSKRMPPNGHWGASATVNERIALFKTVRGDLSFRVVFDGWDAVNMGSDHHLGTSDMTYSARIFGVWVKSAMPGRATFRSPTQSKEQ